MTTAFEIIALTRRAEQQLQVGNVAAAIDAYRTLLDVAPGQANAWFNLGYLYRAARQFDEALAAYAKALAHSISEPEAAHVNRAAILSEHLLRFGEAEQALKAALIAAPRFIPAWHNLGQLYEDLNDLAAARETYNAVIAFAPNDGRSHARLTALDIFEGQEKIAIARLQALIKAAENPLDCAELDFALANALDAAGEYAAAFATATRANLRARALLFRPYDRVLQDQLIDAMIAAFPGSSPETFMQPGRPEPVFVCGMFRSGSTLCEQVLARHSRITAGGELEALTGVGAGVLRNPKAAAALSTEGTAILRATYLAEVQRLFPDSDLLTDKRPENFLYIGLIKNLFPRARIIHTVRDPRDTMLSAFFLFFGDGVPYANSLEDFAHYHAGYRRLMAHWERLYPDIVRFDYDAFVAEPETSARKLLSRLNLDWEANCNPDQPVAANVRTASAWQVRQPIHRRSAGRWRHYASQIASVTTLLEEPILQKKGDPEGPPDFNPEIVAR